MLINWSGVAALNLAVAVALGAFGAHALQGIVTAEQFAWWHTGVEYYFYHGIGLLVVSLFIKLGMAAGISAWLLQIGIIIFAGSLFAMALGAPRWLGAITPIGGILLIVAWVWLAVVAFRHPTLI